jgi:hypothetical protein
VDIATPRDAGRSRKRISVIYKLAVSLTIVLSILLVAGIYRMGSNGTFAGVFLGAWFIHLGSRPAWKHLGVAAVAGAILAAFYASLGGTFGKDAGLETLSLVMGIGAFLGLGSLVAMSFTNVWTGSSRYSTAVKDAVILPAFSIVAGLFMQFASGGLHASFDFMLYRFDASLKIKAGHAAVVLFREVPWIRAGSFFTYSGLAIFAPLFHGWAMFKGKAARINLLHAFLIAGVAGFLLYQICPALGPIYTFGPQFPDSLPPMATIPAKTFQASGLFNAMPSMHMTWVLLVWIAAWDLGFFAVAFASILVLFTGFATLGFGEHYLIDLVVAVPLVMAVHGVCISRYKITGIGLGMVIAWCVYLRTGLLLPAPLNWILVIGTLTATAYLFISSRTALHDIQENRARLEEPEKALFL